MSILDIFKKSQSKPNINTLYVLPPLTNHTDYGTFVHAYGISPQDPTIFIEYENGIEVSKLHFSISKNELKICDFLASGEDKDYHHGTEMIIALLRYLNQPITKIHGVLSPIDANNMNWSKSIPFYADLAHHIFARLGRKYEFYLFDDEHYKNDVTQLLASENERESNIEKYRLSHLFDEEGNDKKRFGSFHYILL